MKPFRKQVQATDNGRRALHIAALAQLAIAYPLFRVLREFPEFFVAQQAGPSDILGLSLLVSLALPLAWFGILKLLSTLHPALERWFFGVSILALGLLLGLTLPIDLPGPLAQSAFALLLGAGLALAYFRTVWGRWFVHFLWPAIIVVPAWFLGSAEIRPLLRPAATVPAPSVALEDFLPPVVFVVFDELPTLALMNSEGDINGDLFPNFHALAETSLWFPHATTVATSTVLAVPALVTGRYPDAFRMPNARQYRRTLFSWLHPTHELRAWESASHLCPRKMCGQPAASAPERGFAGLVGDAAAIYLNIALADIAAPLVPDIESAWSDFWATGRPGNRLYQHRLRHMDDFIQQIQPSERPRLDFLHANFPHIPYEYLPSGKRYQEGWLMPGLNSESRLWDGPDWQVASARQRFLLQLQAADAWLGRLIRHLEAEGLFAPSAIVITADHGVSFTPGWGRRDVPPTENLHANILPVPLIIKAPGQVTGRRSLANAETIDILPTLAQLLGRKLDWPVDGVSLLAEGDKPDGKQARYGYRDLTLHRAELGEVAASMREALENDAFGALQGTGDLYRVGPHAALIGTRADALTTRRLEGLRVSIDHPAYFQDVDPDAGFLPAHVSGSLRWATAATPDIVIALNDRIAAITRGMPAGGERWSFSAMLPETMFRHGANEVRVYGLEFTQAAEPVLLATEGAGGGPDWAWDFRTDTLSRDGRVLEADARGIEGGLDYISQRGANLEVMGWSIDARDAEGVQAVLVFTRDGLAWSGATRMPRDEVHAYGVVLDIGFQALIPGFQDKPANIAVVAVTGDGRYVRLRRER